jgi:predicted lysophospholipase L1 biosynthesis ABC-type transport system permease subunit
VNFGAADISLIIEILVVLSVLATLSLVLFAGLSRRRQEVCVLKSIGFVRRQVAAAVRGQSAMIMAIAVGQASRSDWRLRWAWNLTASNFGVVSVVQAPAWEIVALATGALIVAELVASVPAGLAARVRPGPVLRSCEHDRQAVAIRRRCEAKRLVGSGQPTRWAGVRATRSVVA